MGPPYPSKIFVETLCLRPQYFMFFTKKRENRLELRKYFVSIILNYHMFHRFFYFSIQRKLILPLFERLPMQCYMEPLGRNWENALIYWTIYTVAQYINKSCFWVCFNGMKQMYLIYFKNYHVSINYVLSIFLENLQLKKDDCSITYPAKWPAPPRS